jgi:hypothetical protein
VGMTFSVQDKIKAHDENKNFLYQTNFFTVITIYNIIHFSLCTEVYSLSFIDAAHFFSTKSCHKSLDLEKESISAQCPFSP